MNKKLNSQCIFISISEKQSLSSLGEMCVRAVGARLTSSSRCLLQVRAGSGLDVGFVLISPSGHHLVSDFRRSDAIHMWVL